MYVCMYTSVSTVVLPMWGWWWLLYTVIQWKSRASALHTEELANETIDEKVQTVHNAVDDLKMEHMGRSMTELASLIIVVLSRPVLL